MPREIKITKIIYNNSYDSYDVFLYAKYKK